MRKNEIRLPMLFHIEPKLLAPDSKVIIISADVQTEARRKVMELKAIAMLSKPVKTEELDVIIRANI